MKPPMSESANLEPEARLLEAIQTYYARRDRGELVDSASILEQFPDVLDGLGEFLSGVQCLERFSRESGPGAVARGARHPDSPPRAVGEYVIEGELGHGGMGVVYRVWCPATHRHVALKMLRWGRYSTPAQLQRFQLEIQAVAALDHPHIVPIYNVGEFEGRPFFTMKLLEGGALSQRLETFRNDPARGARVILEIARALDEAHARGILHRDVKPHNILLDTSGEPYLTDFGLAKFHARPQDLTRSIATIGSPQYMAPEQARGESRNVTTAADVYGLGATLYALLTGRPPFESESLFDLLHQIQTVAPVPPTRFNGLVPGDLEVICLKCLSKDRTDRYATAGELADDLQAQLDGTPVRARPPRSMARLRMWCRRNRRLAAVSAMLVLVLLAGTSVSTYFWRVAESRLAGMAAAKEDAEASNRLMTAAKERAEGSYRLSRQALDRSVKLIIDDPRLQSGPLEKLRLDVASAQLEFYEQFVAEYGRDPTYAGDLAYSHLNMGHLSNQFGEQERALKHFEQARGLYEQLAADPDGIKEFGKKLATCWNQVASIEYDRKRNGEVENAYTHAREILERVVAQDPGDFEAALYLAETLKNQGNLRRDMGRSQDAVELHQQAVQLARDTWRTAPSSWSRGTLAFALNDLGFSFERTIRWDVEGLPHWDEADAAYREAGNLFRELTAAEPDNVGWLTGLAYVHMNLASINGTVHPEVAEAEYTEGLKIRKRLAREHPEVPGYTVRFAESVGYFGDMLRMNRRLDEATEAYRTALRISGETIARGAEAVSLRRVAAYAHYGLGRTHLAALKPTEAIASLNEAARIYSELIAEIPEMSAVVEMQVLVDEALADTYAQVGNSDAGLHWRRQNVADGRRLLTLGATDEKYVKSLAAAVERLEAAELQSNSALQKKPDTNPELTTLREQVDAAERIRLAGHPADAISPIDQVIAELAKHESQLARDQDLRKLAADAHAGRAKALSALGRHAEAVGSWERAIEYDGDRSAWMRINRARELTLAGRIEDAAEAVDEAVQQCPGLKPIELRAAAGVLATCAGVVPFEGKRYREYTQASVALLRRAIENGYKNVEELDQAGQFAVIRALPEYATLTARLRQDSTANTAE